MSWEKTIHNYQVLIEERLNDYFFKVIRDAKSYHPFIAEVYSDLREYILRRGKRLASYSTLLTYEGYAGMVDDNILNVCGGIEIYRHCFLVHDDIVDMDVFRRGGNTLHKKFEKNYDDQFGEGVALFVGDIAYALALQVIIDSGFPDEKVIESILLLSNGYREINESQILDLLFKYKDVDVNEWYIMLSKRAATLFKVTMLIGARLADALEDDIKILEEVAMNIGYSFDIQDDIIDTFAQEQQYGKPLGRDITLGRKPLHILYALNSSNRDGSKTLRSFMGKQDISHEEMNKIRTLIRQNKGLDVAKETSKKYATRARELVAQTNLRRDVKDLLDSLISFIAGSLNWYN
jgi:geranylgeranyl pyrophosphate synthase